MGGWRDRYRAFAEDVKPEPGVGLSGQRFAFHYGLPVDSAGALPNGPPFQDVRDFKKLLLLHEEQTVARNLAHQLTTYATGAPVGFADRKQIEQILERSRDSGYGVRSLVPGIVQSDLFSSKDPCKQPLTTAERKRNSHVEECRNPFQHAQPRDLTSQPAARRRRQPFAAVAQHHGSGCGPR